MKAIERAVYRGKNIETGEWAEGSYVWHHSYVGKNEIVHLIISDGKLTDGRSRVDPDTVGQWTGLKDKDGTKIFE